MICFIPFGIWSRTPATFLGFQNSGKRDPGHPNSEGGPPSGAPAGPCLKAWTLTGSPPATCSFFIKWAKQTKSNLELRWPLQGTFRSDQIRSVAQSCPTLCDPMNRSTPGLPGHHQLPEFTETRVHRVSDAIQPSHPLSSPSPPAPNPSQHQSLLQCVNSSHEVAKVLEFQL